MTPTRVPEVLQQQVADELLVLAPGQHEAHALNASAALVFRLCDGRHDRGRIAESLHRHTGLPAAVPVVDLALAELHEAGLLQSELAPAAPSRLALSRQLGLAPAQARLLPQVDTALLPAAGADGPKPARVPDVRYVPITDDAIDEMLALARPAAGELVVEPGCGDARLLAAAALRHGCRGLGIDIDPQRVAESRATLHRLGVHDRVRVIEGDMFQCDLSAADVVLLYILPTLNARLLPRLARLKPGARVVSHDFEIPGVVPDRAVQVYAPDTQLAKTYFLSVAPLKPAGQHPVRRQWAQSSPIR